MAMKDTPYLTLTSYNGVFMGVQEKTYRDMERFGYDYVPRIL